LLDVRNPYNGRLVAKTSLATGQDLEDAIEKSLLVKEEMKAMPSFHRHEILMQIASSMKNSREYLAGILCDEAAKPWRYAVGEIDRAIQTFIIASEEAKRLPAEYISLDWTPSGERKEGLVKYFPIGLVAGISPFNFPMNLAVHKIAPAIASGCPIILKPSSQTPLSTLELAKIIDNTGLPKGGVSILPMDRMTGNKLVTDDRIKLLSFTGSPEVGWQMKKKCGKKKTILELGGNAGVIVTESVNIESAINRCIVGGFAYSGQVCIHAQRFYIHEDIFPEFVSKFVSSAKNLKSGAPLDPDTEISSMIDEKNAIRVEEWVNEAVTSGAKVLAGGRRNGSFYPPTVLTNVSRKSKVCRCEVFGPVVILQPYSNFREAINDINDSRFGLQAGVFTNNIEEMNLAFDNLVVGGVIINDVPTFRVDHMPYGGVKDSGLGREGVKYAILDMMEAKILVKNS